MSVIAHENVSMPPPNLEAFEILDGNHAEKRTTPKFASFNPKRAPRAQTPERKHSYVEGRRRDDRSHASSTDALKRQQYSSSKGHSQGPCEHRTEKERAQHPLQSFSGWAEKQNGESFPLYVIDRLGDPNILTFGSLNRYAIPSYLRFGSGAVLGPVADRKIDRPASDAKGLVLSYIEHGRWSKGDRRDIWRAAKTGSKDLKIRPQPSSALAIDHDADFVSLRASRRARKSRNNDYSSAGSSSDSDEAEAHYRSIEGKAKTRDSPKDDDLTYATDVSLSSNGHHSKSSTMNRSVLNRRTDLSRKVEKDPTSCDAWLDLIEYQEKILESTMESKRTILTNAEQRSNAEIKLSIYEKAISNVRDPDGRELLLLGKMREAARVWDSQRLLSEWQHILRDDPAYLNLWKEYLSFRQTTFASFRYEEVLGSYTSCLSLLKHAKTAPGVSLTEREKLYTVQVYIILRMTVFMRESGFVEQAVAAWQALLEYEFSRPSDLCGPEHTEGGSLHSTTVSKFEQFWDSEVPRIGEDNCEGWAKFSQAGGEAPQAKAEKGNHLEDARNLWEPWVVLERGQGLLARTPARTIDDVVENDPYRVIIFSDVQLFLTQSPSVESRAVCLDAFLLFCHLPPNQEEDPDSRSKFWRREGYLRNEVLSSPREASQSFIAQSSGPETLAFDIYKETGRESDSASLMHSLFNLPITDYQLSSDTLFAPSGSWFSPFVTWYNSSLEDRGPLDRAWVRRTLKQLVAMGAGGENFAEYFLALELHLAPEAVKKTARGLLKKKSSSMQLYNAYALAEDRLGNARSGENILNTSIKMVKSLDEDARRGSILLWRTWIWELLNAGDTRKAFEIMLMYGEEEIPSDLPSGSLLESHSLQPALLLRAERAFTASRDHLLSLGLHKYAAFAIDCLVMFHYLKSALSLSVATAVFKSNWAHLTTYTSSITSTHELIYQSFARLLYHHVTHTHLFKPSEIRSLLAESINFFPHNTIFLSLYAWNEAQFRFDDRVRSIVKEVILARNGDGKTKRQDSVIPHFFAVNSELSRGVTFGSNVSTIRSTFERAVESDSGAHCAGLWKLYLLFEHSRGAREKAKSVFWRAVRACPWAKELYLLAFEYLKGAGGFGNEDLRGVYELMVDKEIRIHVNLEDYFDDMDERTVIGQVG